MSKIKPENFIFILILVFSFIIRVIHLDIIPSGMYLDHINKAYDAFSILKTGKNVYGERFPLFFKTVGDFREPIYIYSMSLFIFFFGLSKVSVTLTSVFYSILTIIATYFFVKETFGTKEALISSFFIAISPWNLVLSRNVFRVITLPFFFIMGLYFWKKSNFKNIKYLVLSGIFFGLTLYTYSTARLFVPLILFFLFLVDIKNIYKNRTKIIVFLISLFLISIPFAYKFLKNYSEIQQRFNDLSIFNFYKDKDLIYYIKIFFENYFKHMSMDFLFLKGDQNYRHSVPNYGQLHIFELPFLIIGIIVCILMKNHYYKIILFWFLIFPIPASLTYEGIPHGLRSYNGFPVFEIISSIGLVFIIEKLKKPKLIFYLFSLLIIILVFYISFKFIDHYFQNYNRLTYIYYSRFFDDAVKQAIEMQNDYDKIIIDADIMGTEFYVAFYSKMNPEDFQINRIKNSKICNINECEDFNGKILLITDKKRNFNLIKEIKSYNNNTEFYFYETANYTNPIYPDKWILCGPFNNDYDDGINIDYINEYKTDIKDLKCENWNEVKIYNDYVNFGDYFANITDKVFYALTIIKSENDTSASLWYGSDDGIKIWLNGELIINEHVHRTISKYEEIAYINLKSGDNIILIKVENNNGQSGFYVGFEDMKAPIYFDLPK
ncbi:MAG: glycosyltransferase family 39 protein [Candidatus Aenigmatarchaeota archaeon]